MIASALPPTSSSVGVSIAGRRARRSRAEAPGSRASIGDRALAAVRGHEVQAPRSPRPGSGRWRRTTPASRPPAGSRPRSTSGAVAVSFAPMTRAATGLRPVERRAVGLGEGDDDRRLGAGPDAARDDEHAQVVARAGSRRRARQASRPAAGARPPSGARARRSASSPVTSAVIGPASVPNGNRARRLPAASTRNTSAVWAIP